MATAVVTLFRFVNPGLPDLTHFPGLTHVSGLTHFSDLT